MSDLGRKNFGDKVNEAVKPDSQKTTTEQAKEYATDAYDRVAGAVQPEENKSVGQKAGDVGRDAKDNVKDASGSVHKDASAQGDSLLEQAQNAAKGALDTAGEYVQQATDYIKGEPTTGTK